MRRRDFLKAMGLTILSVRSSGICAAPAVGGSKRPNILVIFSDDQGWGDLESQRQPQPEHSEHRLPGP